MSSHKPTHKNARDLQESLGYMLVESQKSFELLCHLNQAIQQRLTNRNRTTASFNLEQEVLCMRAIKAYLCLMIGKMFDKDKRNQSFYELAVQKTSLGIQISDVENESIIQKIKKDRNTWDAHMSKQAEKSVYYVEICNSNLSDLLKKLGKILIKPSE